MLKKIWIPTILLFIYSLNFWFFIKLTGCYRRNSLWPSLQTDSRRNSQTPFDKWW